MRAFLVALFVALAVPAFAQEPRFVAGLSGGQLFWVPSTQPVNAWAQLVAPLNGTTYIDNVGTIENDSIGSAGQCGNAAIRYRDSIIHYERGAIGYSSIATGCTSGFHPDHLFAEIGNIGPAADPDDTSWAIVNTHAVGATNFPNTQYLMEELRGDTGNITWFDHTGAKMLGLTESTRNVNIPIAASIGTTSAPLSALDVGAGGLAVGSYAGSSAAPANSIIVSGSIVAGATAGAANVKIDAVGTSAIHADCTGGNTAAGTVLSAECNSGTNGIRYTFAGQGATIMGYNGGGTLNTDGSKITLYTGNATPASGTVVGTFSGTAATLPFALINSGITADTGHTDATVCEDTTTHQFYSGTGTLGICLGTSSLRYKRDWHLTPDGLTQVMALKPGNYFYRKGFGDNGVRAQYGFLAEDVVRVLPKLVGLDNLNRPNSVDILGMVPVMVKAMQQQQAEIAELRTEIRALRRHR